MSLCQRNNVLIALLLVSAFTSIHLILTPRLGMDFREITRCLKNNTCPVCEETKIVTASVPASVPITKEAAGQPSDAETGESYSVEAEDVASTTMAPTIFATTGSSESNQENIYFRNTSRNVSMDDPGFLQYLRRDILVPPLPIKYKLDDPRGDPSVHEGQNQVVLQLLKNKRNGLFVEAGANQGEYLSNTLVLERDMGWTGLLVEPDEISFGKLLSRHRKAWAANVCLSTEKKPQKLKFMYNSRHPDVSHLAAKRKIEKWSRASDLVGKIVKCVPVFSLLLAINLTEVDYFSLDVEGAELDVLKTIPFDRLTIRTFSIEFDHIVRIPGADEELKTLMKNNGYRLVTQVTRGNAKDYIFAHSSV